MARDKRKMSEVFAQDDYGDSGDNGDASDEPNPWTEHVGPPSEPRPMVEGPYGSGMSDRNIMHPDFLSEEERRKRMDEDI